jgi:hypothetical protein
MDGKGGRRLWIDVGRTEYMMETRSSLTRTFCVTIVLEDDRSGVQRRKVVETFSMLEAAGLAR